MGDGGALGKVGGHAPASPLQHGEDGLQFILRGKVARIGEGFRTCRGAGVCAGFAFGAMA